MSKQKYYVNKWIKQSFNNYIDYHLVDIENNIIAGFYKEIKKKSVRNNLDKNYYVDFLIRANAGIEFSSFNEAKQYCIRALKDIGYKPITEKLKNKIDIFL